MCINRLKTSHLTFTVDGDGSFGILTDVEELSDDRVVRRTPVHKEQVVMLEAGVCETPGVVHFLVESDDTRDVVFPEIRDVGLGSVQRVSWRRKENVLWGLGVVEEDKRFLCIKTTILYFAFGMGPAKCKEFPRNDPVQISIFCSLIVLVFFHIKVGEVEPTVLQRLVERNLIPLGAWHSRKETNEAESAVPCEQHAGSRGCSDCTCRFQTRHLWKMMTDFIWGTIHSEYRIFLKIYLWPVHFKPEWNICGVPGHQQTVSLLWHHVKVHYLQKQSTQSALLLCSDLKPKLPKFHKLYVTYCIGAY